jgi:hypothetical protein
MPIEMVVFRETTSDWAEGSNVKNGTYILSPDKQWMYGYIPWGKCGRDVKLFKNRIQFDKRHRTFVRVKG